MSQSVLHRTVLTVIECHECAAPYALAEQRRSRYQEVGGSWRCPYCGVVTVYRKTDLEKKQAELDRAQSSLVREQVARKRAEDERDTAENRRRAEKAAKTRLKNRVGKGICPCCKRSFANLQRHMANQHPEFAGDES